MGRVLITGSPRSGTTPIGSLIQKFHRFKVFYEPFHPHHGHTKISEWYVDERTEEIDSIIEDIHSLRPCLKKGIRANDSIFMTSIKSIIGARSNVTRISNKLFLNSDDTLVLKDPTAVFLSDKLMQEHNYKVLVTIRNPFSIAASHKRKGWMSGDYSRFFDRYVVKIGEFRGEYNTGNAAVRSAILWRLIYDYVSNLEGRHMIVNVDKFVQYPLEELGKIAEFLDCHVTKSLENAVEKRYVNKNRDVKRTHDFVRNPQQLINDWKSELNHDEIDFVQRCCGDLWNKINI